MMRFSFCRIAVPAAPSGPMRLAGAVLAESSASTAPEAEGLARAARLVLDALEGGSGR